MNKESMVQLLQKMLEKSRHPDWWNDDIQPSARRKYEGDVLGNQVEMLIEILKIGD